jgi:hypothetical protein
MGLAAFDRVLLRAGVSTTVSRVLAGEGLESLRAAKVTAARDLFERAGVVADRAATLFAGVEAPVLQTPLIKAILGTSRSTAATLHDLGQEAESSSPAVEATIARLDASLARVRDSIWQLRHPID